MAETTIFVEASREVPVDAEKAWLLLGSAAVWSLRPGYFAFDAATADPEPIRCLLQSTSTGIAAASVLTLCADNAGAAAAWEFSSTGAEVTFSAEPHRRGALISAALKFATDRSTARHQKRKMDRILRVWLIRAGQVLEGREAWPAGMPADLRRACVARPRLEPTQSASAAVLIAAPLDVVWKAVWSPGTLRADDPGSVACGHVPGTPLQEPGEMQYFVNRTSDGRLGLGLIIVREIANQRRAVTQVPYPPHTEMIYLLGAEQDATRLELTARWRDAAKAPESQIMGRAVPDFVRSAVDSYKSILEETERAPQGPLSDQENP